MVSKTAYIAQAFLNDLKYIYSHTYGQGFENLQKLVVALGEELDQELYELTAYALQNGEDIDNASNIKSHLDMESEWTVLEKWSNVDAAFQELDQRILRYIAHLFAADISPVAKSTYIRYWQGMGFNIEKETITDMIVSEYKTLKD